MNKNRKEISIKVGQRIMWDRRLPGGITTSAAKMSRKYDGPFVVSKVSGVNISFVAGGQVETVHVSRVKPYHARSVVRRNYARDEVED